MVLALPLNSHRLATVKVLIGNTSFNAGAPNAVFWLCCLATMPALPHNLTSLYHGRCVSCWLLLSPYCHYRLLLSSHQLIGSFPTLSFHIFTLVSFHWILGRNRCLLAWHDRHQQGSYGDEHDPTISQLLTLPPLTCLSFTVTTQRMLDTLYVRNTFTLTFPHCDRILKAPFGPTGRLGCLARRWNTLRYISL